MRLSAWPEAIDSPSDEMATERVLEEVPKGKVVRHDALSQRRTDPSIDPDTMTIPSSDIATALTLSV
jgi:hypothetical protein